MSSSGSHAVSAAARLVVVAVAAGLLVAAILMPVVGAIGVGARDAANKFNTLSVPKLGQVPTRSKILDSKGRLIAYYYPNNLYRIPVTYNQIAPVMRKAIVAIEDSRFWKHGAMDFRGTVRALANNLHHSATQGGSTLAQQYVKNTLILTATTKQQQAAAIQDTVARKIRELRIAVNVTHEMTRKQLLAAYLNVAYFENNAYGIQVAAERYFKVSARKLSLTQAALLAGIVENPSAYDPFTAPNAARQRRNTVLARMAQVGYITQKQAAAAEKTRVWLHPSTVPLQTGCISNSARKDAWFCDYVLAAMRTDPAYAKAYSELNTQGGLTIHTTLNATDQRAANNAVNFVVPDHSPVYNPGHNADTEVLIQPGTGKIRAIAVDRPYGYDKAKGQETVDYAVDQQYDGGEGVQTGSSSKLFTLLTALKQGVPFGFAQHVVSPTTMTGYHNCAGAPIVTPWPVQNAEGADKGTFTLYNGTTQSINVFFAHLEKKVGLCNTVKTAISLGLHRSDGRSLLQGVGKFGTKSYQYPADDLPGFTLGELNVSPMSMAAAYATVAARGMYCRPVAITKILGHKGHQLPVEHPRCHRVVSKAVADAANHILQGVLTTGTAAGQGIGRPAAGKTGTSDGGYYAAFAGYTPTLAGYVSVFNPKLPTTTGAMVGNNSCYRANPMAGGGLDCPGQMYGANAPAATWQMTFEHAALGPARSFVSVPPNSPFYRLGTGVNSPKPKKPKSKKASPKPSPPGHGGLPLPGTTPTPGKHG